LKEGYTQAQLLVLEQILKKNDVNITMLPNDVIKEIINFMNMNQLYEYCYTNKTNYKVCQENHYFKMFMKTINHKPTIACGDKHILMIEGSKVYGFGQNDQGQLGIPVNNTEFYNKKRIITSLNKKNVESVSCGINFSIVKTNTDYWSFGVHQDGQLGSDIVIEYGPTVNGYIDKPNKGFYIKNIKSVNCGKINTFIITNDKELYFFGNNPDYYFIPEVMEKEWNDNHNYYQFIFKPYKINVTDVLFVSVGYKFVLINTLHGLYGMGSNREGQIGVDDVYEIYNYPVKIDINNVITMSSGLRHSLILTVDGLYGIGNNYFGLDEDIDDTSDIGPQKLPINHDNIMFISCGYFHSIIVKSDGIYGCGLNFNEQMGKTPERYLRKFTLLNLNINVNDIIEITSGGFFTVIKTVKDIHIIGNTNPEKMRVMIYN
jgi:alpha-tubulin suppressor-like RCC1 family protein